MLRKKLFTIVTLATFLAIIMSIFHLYAGLFGVFPLFIQRGGHLTFVMVLIFLTHPFSSSKKKWFMWVVIVLAILSR